MDLLQETSSIWNEFLTKPCPWVDLLSLWPRHPWHLLNLGTFENFCPLTPLEPFKPWHPWKLLSPDTFVRVHYSMVQYSDMKIEIRLYCTVPYCTVLYCTVLYCSFSCWYTPLNQAIYAWSFRQKFYGGGGGDIAIIASSSRGPGEI